MVGRGGIKVLLKITDARRVLKYFWKHQLLLVLLSEGDKKQGWLGEGRRSPSGLKP